MPLDAYSLCPGGTGKRIKFCCKDMLPELQHVERMIEGEQHHACVQHIDTLEKKYPERACLWSIKCQLLRALGDVDTLQGTVARFVAKHPDNVIALSEQAMLTAVEETGRQGVALLQKALTLSGAEVPGRLYEALGVVAEVLLSEGEVIAARALLLLQTAIHREETRPFEMAMQISASPRVPLLLRDDPDLDECPADVQWKAAFQEALAPVAQGFWAAAVERLSALTARTGDAPAVWRNLARLKSWLADSEGAAAAYRKYASISVPMEDAVEAKALAVLMSAEGLGDNVDILSLEYAVQDVEGVQVALASSARAVGAPIPADAREEDGGPPPKAAFLILDRPDAKGEAAAPERTPRIIGQFLLYGRQTDRAARLFCSSVVACHLDSVRALMAEMPAGSAAAEPQQETLGKTSRSRELLQPNWRVPRDMPSDQMVQLVESLRERALLVEWPQTPLGLLAGKTPQQAAAESAHAIRLAAAVLVVQQWFEQSGGRFDFNRLRTQLGLAPMGLIDPSQVDVERLPLVRLARLDVEKLSDDALATAFHRATTFRVAGVEEKFAAAVVERPLLAGREEQRTAFRVLVRHTTDVGAALTYLERGRQADEAAGNSSAAWDLLELSLRLERGEPAEMQRLMEHIQREHIREPGVAEALTRFLVQIGALRPDGRAPGGAPPQAAMEPSIMASAPGGPAPGKIWTPDSASGGGSSGKLWTPE